MQVFVSLQWPMLTFSFFGQKPQDFRPFWFFEQKKKRKSGGIYNPPSWGFLAQLRDGISKEQSGLCSLFVGFHNFLGSIAELCLVAEF